MNPNVFRKLPTEQRNPKTAELDSLSITEILKIINREDKTVALAVEKEIAKISHAVHLMTDALNAGGRIFFVGAGTSGRLGVLEAAEMPPTFNTPASLAQAIMAGGTPAVFQSQEGAEDNAVKAAAEIKKRVKKWDIVIGIAASGVTPFVRSAIETAKKIGAKTVLVTCNSKTPFKNLAHVSIAPQVGPEVIAGSTRLKSATATKMVLNMMSVTAMVQMGKVYGNRMVDLQPKSKKLVERGIRLIEDICGVDRPRAVRYFTAAKGHVKTAIVMAFLKLNYKQAQSVLEMYSGFLRKIIN